MSEPSGLKSELSEDAAPSVTEPQTERKEHQDEDMKYEEEEEEMSRSAHLEPATLPWPGDKDKKPQTDDDDGIWSEKGVSEAEEPDTGISGGSQDLSEKHSHTESHGKNANKWRESMPEGDRWRDDDAQIQPHEKGSGSMADDEAEDEDEEDDEDGGMKWMEEKPAPVFTPRVTIVRPSSKELHEKEHFIDRDTKEVEPESTIQFYDEYPEPDDKYYLCENSCGEKLKVVLGTVAGALLFPFLVWVGYSFLPFDSPLLDSAPLRVVYTLRCSLFAMVPILLGVLVQGVARLRHSSLKPLYQGQQVHREVAVHWHFVNESLALFLFYFLQLAVMATYVSQDLIKMVPLLTIIFAFGRLIYWLCLSLCSSFRGFGFSFSFFPMLVMLGVNLYYVCTSVGQATVFDVQPPTTAPPPRHRWFG